MSCCDTDETLHNSLGGLQGGVTNERYHLTKDQWHTIATGAGFNTFLNGLTATNGVVKLGGELSADTSVTLAESASLTLGNANCRIIVQPGTPQLSLLAGTDNPSSIQMFDNLVNIATGSLSLVLDNENQTITIQDNTAQRGVVYYGDYETNFVNRSLVTKQYVDQAIADAIAAL